MLQQDTFKQLFQKHYAHLRNFIYYKSGDRDLAEDIVQEAYVKVWDRREEIHPETAKTYLYTTANNMMLNHIKHGKVVLNFTSQYKSEYEHAHAEAPDFTLQMKEFDAQLQAAVNEIPEKSREVFLMNRIDGLTYQEISERLSLSVKAVEKRMSKALEVLREQIAYKI